MKKWLKQLRKRIKIKFSIKNGLLDASHKQKFHKNNKQKLRSWKKEY